MSVFIESCWSHILGEQTCVLGIVAEHTVRLLPPHHSPTSHWEAADRFHGDLSVHQAFGEQPNVLQHLLLSHPVLCQCSPQTSTILSSDPCVQVQKPLMHHSFVLLQSNSPAGLQTCFPEVLFASWCLLFMVLHVSYKSSLDYSPSHSDCWKGPDSVLCHHRRSETGQDLWCRRGNQGWAVQSGGPTKLPQVQFSLPVLTETILYSCLSFLP